MIKSLVSLFLIYSLVGFFLPPNHFSMAITGIGLLIVSFLLFQKSITKKNFPFLVFSIFVISYCIEPVWYLFGYSSHIIDRITQAETPSTVYLTAHCLLTFILVILRFVDFSVPQVERFKHKFISIPRGDAFWVVYVIATICMIFGASGDTIFESGGYGQGNTERSSLYEYGIIFLCLSLIYTKKASNTLLVYLLALAFIAKDLLYGGRVTSVMIILAVFMINFLNRYSFKTVLIAAFFGYTFFKFWGVLRGDVNNYDFEMGSRDGNAQFVVYASMRIHYLIDRGLLPIQDRIVSFVSYLLSSIVPASYLPDLYNLAKYKTDDYYSGGGGLVSSYYYCWLWIPGVYFIAYWISKTMNNFFRSKTIYWKFYALLIVITMPRWFSYYPTQIIKFSVIGTLAFYLVNRYFKIRVSKYE